MMPKGTNYGDIGSEGKKKQIASIIKIILGFHILFNNIVEGVKRASSIEHDEQDFSLIFRQCRVMNNKNWTFIGTPNRIFLKTWKLRGARALAPCTGSPHRHRGPP